MTTKIYITDAVREATYISARDGKNENCASTISNWILTTEFPSSEGWRLTPQKYFPQSPGSLGSSRPDFTVEKMSTTDNQTLFVPCINLDAKKESDTPNLVQALDAARNALSLYPGQNLIFGRNLTGSRMHFWVYHRGTPSLTMMTPTEGLNVFSKDQEIHNHFRMVKVTAL